MSHSTEALVIALVRRAARNAPSALSARLEEEWLADAQERTSNLSRLRFAAGCYWASIAIGLEHRPASVPAAGAAHGNTASIVLEPPRFLSSRAVTFGLVLSLHAAVFCGLMLGGTTYFKPAEPPAIQPRVIERPLPQIKPPPPSIDHSLVDRRVSPPVLPPDVVPAQPQLPNVVTAPELLSEPRGTPGSLPSREIARVQGGIGPAFPHPADFYPDVSRRFEEQGAALVQVCVDTAGRLTSEPVSTQSSGSARLDAAAIKLAKAGSGHYRPTTEGGRPVSACYPIKIRFQLQN